MPLLLLFSVFLLCSCTLSSGVVTDVARHKDGSLTLRKCDLDYMWLVYVETYATRNCKIEERR